MYPSQEHFNKEHETPREYGEGDYIFIGTQFDEATAKQKLIDEIEAWTGSKASESYDLDSFGKYPVGIGYNEDNEPDYCANPKSITPLEAWGMAQ